MTNKEIRSHALFLRVDYICKRPQNFLSQTNTMDPSIRQRLLTLESDFLSAVNEGDAALEAFEINAAKLRQDIDAATASNTVDNDTLVLAHGVASNIASLAAGLHEFSSEGDTYKSDLDTDLDSIFTYYENGQVPAVYPTPTSPPPSFSRMLSPAASDTWSTASSSTLSPSPSATWSSASSTATLSPSPPPSPREAFRRKRDENELPPYIGSAYTWLLENLHNPYPSPEQIAEFCLISGRSSEAIRKWFTAVRCRIGWTEIRGELFYGGRDEAIEAAIRVFIGSDDDDEQPVPGYIQEAFFTMKARAERIYEKTCQKSTVARGLSSVIKALSADEKKDMVNRRLEAAERRKDDHANAKESRRLDRVRKSQHQRLLKHAKELREAGYSVSALLESGNNVAESDRMQDTDCEGESNTSPAPQAGLKRKQTSSSTGSLETAPVRSAGRPIKRLRCVLYLFNIKIPLTTELRLGATASLPSIPVSGAAPSVRVNRKRGLSESDGSYSTPKRPRGISTVPRHQTVSDPIRPSQSSPMDLETVFEQSFEIPQPATLEAPGSSRNLAISIGSVDPSWSNNSYDWDGMPELSPDSQFFSSSFLSMCTNNTFLVGSSTLQDMDSPKTPDSFVSRLSFPASPAASHRGIPLSISLLNIILTFSPQIFLPLDFINHPPT